MKYHSSLVLFPCVLTLRCAYYFLIDCFLPSRRVFSSLFCDHGARFQGNELLWEHPSSYSCLVSKTKRGTHYRPEWSYCDLPTSSFWMIETALYFRTDWHSSSCCEREPPALPPLYHYRETHIASPARFGCWAGSCCYSRVLVFSEIEDSSFTPVSGHDVKRYSIPNFLISTWLPAFQGNTVRTLFADSPCTRPSPSPLHPA